MITKEQKPVYTTSDKQEHTSLAEAREHELRILIAPNFPPDNSALSLDETVSMLVAKGDAVADILTTKPTSRPSARKINRKPRAKKSTTPASVETALKYQAGLANTQEPQPA